MKGKMKILPFIHDFFVSYAERLHRLVLPLHR